MRITVIDGQGGNIGRQLVRSIKEAFPELTIRVIGTNSIATSNMLKGGADEAATGENACLVACRESDIITGPIGIIVTDALLGEVTSIMASHISTSPAVKVLLPLNRCDVLVAGTENKTTAEHLEDALKMIRAIITKNQA